MLLAVFTIASAYTVDDLRSAAQRGLPPEAIESIASEVHVEFSADVVLLLRSGVSAEVIRSMTAGAHPGEDEIAAAAELGPVGFAAASQLRLADAAESQWTEPQPDALLQAESARGHRAGVGLVVGGSISLVLATGAFACGAALAPTETPEDPLTFAVGAFASGLGAGFTVAGWTFVLVGAPMVIGGGTMIADHPWE